MRKLVLLVVCLAFPSGIAMAQDAKTVIANAQKALGDVKSITYSGSAKDVSFQQCGANKADMVCRGMHDPMRPIDSYVRAIDLSRGTFDLSFMDIAATVNPATVHFRSLTEPSRVSVLEQNYEYDLLEPEKLLRKYVGREVTLVRTRQEGGTTKEEEVRALLLSYNQGPVWQIGNEIVTGSKPRIWRASCRGMPTTSSPSAVTTRLPISMAG